MHLGAFSLSLAVKDIKASRQFYETLGFEKFHGDMEQGWVIMKSSTAVIGLFQGMFDTNIMTFNPGWNSSAQEINPFEDVRKIQQKLKSSGIAIQNEVDETASGPASFMVTDPDGNTILFDQHR